jgi:hypothetical protein
MQALRFQLMLMSTHMSLTWLALLVEREVSIVLQQALPLLPVLLLPHHKSFFKQVVCPSEQTTCNF